MASLKQKLQTAAIELAEAQKRLREARAAFDEIYRVVTSGSKRRPQPGSAGDEKQIEEAGDNAEDRIEALLLQNPQKEFTYQDIADQVGLKIPSVKSLLYRLKRNHRVSKPRRGIWQAAKSKGQAPGTQTTLT